MPIGAVGGAAGINLSQLAEQFRQQVSSGTEAGGTEGVAATAPVRAAEARSADFASAIGEGLQRLEGLDSTAKTKATQAATGDLTDVHDYVIAATEAQTAVELTTTVRNKALEAFNDIMRMPL